MAAQVPDFEFSKLVIVESLEGEFQSGRQLYDYLSARGEEFENYPLVEHRPVRSITEFQALIANLTREATTGEWPWLHIETHGIKDATGLWFADDTSISWQEVRTTLSSLNVATSMNLGLSMAACFGGQFISELRPGETAPCMSLIGPSGLADPGELFGRYRDFYRVFFDSWDLDAAIAEVNATPLEEGDFWFLRGIDWFRGTVVGYLAQDCTTERLQRRAREHHRSLPVLQQGRVTRAQMIELGRQLAKSLLERSATSFFAFDRVPTSRQRFLPQLEAARAYIEELLRAGG